ncbi:MAG: hypothetical protein A2075_06735 [Geobacteraceae bacterium GWC2_58_44]|nr:MAG: hypothetical protein A2075_06735 [Geobacteraceae bacterium GWC2_58_44]
MRTDKGYTLVELIVVMGIFVIVLVISSYAFEQILSTSARQSKSAESNIDGIIGFEQVRHDVEHAGYGLPWSIQNPIEAYKECDVALGALAEGVDSEAFNDVPPNLPRAILSGTSSKEVNGAAGSHAGLGPDYLVVKSSIAAIDTATKKWSYVNYSSGGNSFIKKWGTSADVADNDRVITLSTTFTQAGLPTRQLVTDDVTPAAGFFYSVNGVNPPAAFQPGDASQFYIGYVVSRQTLKMPYNRADYYIDRPADMPGRCNPNTGLLFKAVANHADDAFTPYPLVDCVGDMQVEFELDPNGNGNTVFTENLLGLSPEQIRAQVKTVRIFFLSHEGRKDTGFKYPETNPAKVLQVGDLKRQSSGRIWSSANMLAVFGSDWRNYRWKIHTIAVRPKNLSR